MSVSVRQFRPSDTPKLAVIYQEDRQRYFPWVDRPDLADFQRDAGHELLLVAEVNGEVSGFISLQRLSNFIHLLFVAPNFQHIGVGHELIEAMRQQASAPMTLKCVVENQAALAFYAHEGFQIIREDQSAVPPNYTLLDTLEERYWYRVKFWN